jgi:hypothetical protein
MLEAAEKISPDPDDLKNDLIFQNFCSSATAE